MWCVNGIHTAHLFIQYSSIWIGNCFMWRGRGERKTGSRVLICSDSINWWIMTICTAFEWVLFGCVWLLFASKVNCSRCFSMVSCALVCVLCSARHRTKNAPRPLFTLSLSIDAPRTKAIEVKYIVNLQPHIKVPSEYWQDKLCARPR